jgi:hypothetical protein
MWNGINTDGKDIFINDLIGKRILRYEIMETKELRLVETIPTQSMVDNLEYDKDHDRFYLGSVPLPYKVMEFNKYAAENPDWKSTGYSIPGGVEVLEKDENGKWHSREVLVQSELTQVSVALRANETLIIGSPYDGGVLFCRPDEFKD